MLRRPIRRYGRTVVVADSQIAFDNILGPTDENTKSSPFCSSDTSHTSSHNSSLSLSLDHSLFKPATRQTRRNLKENKKLSSLKPKGNCCKGDKNGSLPNKPSNSSSLFYEESDSIVMCTPVKKKKQQILTKIKCPSETNKKTQTKNNTRKVVSAKQTRDENYYSFPENVPDFDDIAQDDLIVSSTPGEPDKCAAGRLGRHNASIFSQHSPNVSLINVCSNYQSVSSPLTTQKCVNITLRRVRQTSQAKGEVKSSKKKKSPDFVNLSDAATNPSELIDIDRSGTCTNIPAGGESFNLSDDMDNLTTSFHIMRLRSFNHPERLASSSHNSLYTDTSLNNAGERTDASLPASSPILFEEYSSSISSGQHSPPMPLIVEEDSCCYEEDNEQDIDEEDEQDSVAEEEDEQDIDEEEDEQDSVAEEEDEQDIDEEEDELDSVAEEKDELDSVAEEEDEQDTDEEEDEQDSVAEKEDEQDIDEEEYEQDSVAEEEDEQDSVDEEELDARVDETEDEEMRSQNLSKTTDVTIEELINSMSFSEKLSNSSLCKDVSVTAKERVLSLCCQTTPISFSDSIPCQMMSKCIKIGEGVYGEVFRSFSRGQAVALKIIPIEGDQHVNDCPQKKFDEILPEIVIAKELSDLAYSHTSQASNFCQVHRVSCVQGVFPPKLLEQWDLYSQNKVSENDRPDIFPPEQLFIVFEFVDGGCPLENYKFLNHSEAFSVLRQVVFALAVAESELEFEHRDLHIGNVLVRSCTEETVLFRLQDREYQFPTEGVKATIIDFTISRLKKDGCAVFCDISTDDGLFGGEGDFQFDVYRDMRTENGNDWQKFCPHSNVLWTNYICKKFNVAIKYKETGRSYRNIQRHLRSMVDSILDQSSCLSLSQDSSLWLPEFR